MYISFLFFVSLKIFDFVICSKKNMSRKFANKKAFLIKKMIIERTKMASKKKM